ncbi:MAG: hypothetical protein PHI71_03015 [Acidiphilium sp.]|jgi:hypothetical protein|nr:hypothetical protein [Acidiphilium sp.]
MDQASGERRAGEQGSRIGMILRIIVTVVAVGCGIWMEFSQACELPFHRQMGSDAVTVVKRASMALPAGLEAGDRLPFDQQSRLVLAVLVQPNVPTTVAYPMVVERAGRDLTVPVRTVVESSPGPMFVAIDDLTELGLLALGLLTLWRGRDWAAWGLTLLTMSVLVGSAVSQMIMPPFLNLVELSTQILFTSLGPLLALYITATHLVGRTKSNQAVRDRWFIGVLLVFGIVEFVPLPLLMFWRIGSSGLVNTLIGIGALAILSMPLLILIGGYVAAKPDQRLRIKWIMTGSFLLIPLVVLPIIAGLEPHAGLRTLLVISVLREALTALIFGIYAFAVLSTRLVEVRVVINRAVVFTLLMGLVVGLLALIESLIENSALHGRAGLALEVAAPLVLGIAFDQLQRRIEQGVDRVFFRREHKARETMREFVRDAGFIEQAETLVARMVAVFHHHSGGQGAALFEVRAMMFERTAQHGHRWPEVVGVDDPALVRLRAVSDPIDLHGMESALGADGVALPLALRGRVFGVLVCGPRNAGRYAQTEMVELGQAAKEVGASLFALRAKANEVLVERLALGQIGLQEAAMEARQLSGLSL